MLVAVNVMGKDQVGAQDQTTTPNRQVQSSCCGLASTSARADPLPLHLPYSTGSKMARHCEFAATANAFRECLWHQNDLIQGWYMQDANWCA